MHVMLSYLALNIIFFGIIDSTVQIAAQHCNAFRILVLISVSKQHFNIYEWYDMMVLFCIKPFSDEVRQSEIVTRGGCQCWLSSNVK